MHFHVREKVLIQKAKKRAPWKRTRNYKRLTSLSHAMAGAVRLDFLRGMKKFKARINPEEVYQAWLTRDWDRVYDMFPWKELPGDLAPMAEKLQSGMMNSSQFVINSLPPPISEGLRFDTKNPRIRDYMDFRTGELVVGIQDDTRKFISGAIARQFDEALTPRRVADIIRPSIGLYPGQVTALANYRRNLEKENLSPERIERQTEAYHNRLLDYRATMIARTETRFATNQGQLAVWQEAASQGLVDTATARKKWIVDGNPCPVCDDMEGVEVGIDEPWILEYENGTTKQVMVPTESHPHCMCGMELVYGKTQDKLEEATPEEYNHGYGEDDE